VKGKRQTWQERFGIDIRGKKFWEEGLAVIARRIDRYCEIS
jgi:oligoendopeptidase F